MYEEHLLGLLPLFLLIGILKSQEQLSEEVMTQVLPTS